MPRRPTAKRYALATFEIARASGLIDQCARDLQSAREALQDASFRSYLELPKITLARKVRSLQEALSGANPMVVNLLALLTSRGSLGLLSSVVEEYQRLMDAHFNRERAQVVTAILMESQQEERLSQQLGNLLGKEVVLTTRVDSDILGGLVARVGDNLIDASVRGKLMALHKSLGALRG